MFPEKFATRYLAHIDDNRNVFVSTSMGHAWALPPTRTPVDGVLDGMAHCRVGAVGVAYPALGWPRVVYEPEKKRPHIAVLTMFFTQKRNCWAQRALLHQDMLHEFAVDFRPFQTASRVGGDASVGGQVENHRKQWTVIWWETNI